MSQTKDTFHVLIADDSEEDRFLLKAGSVGQFPHLHTVGEAANGLEVVAYVRGVGQFHNRRDFPLPDLLLLDLKMPFKDGFEVLAWLQERHIYNLTVVVLVDAMQREDIKRALDLGADHYHVKDGSHQDRHQMVLAVEKYLLNRASAYKLSSAA